MAKIWEYWLICKLVLSKQFPTFTMLHCIFISSPDITMITEHEGWGGGGNYCII